MSVGETGGCRGSSVLPKGMDINYKQMRVTPGESSPRAVELSLEQQRRCPCADALSLSEQGFDLHYHSIGPGTFFLLRANFNCTVEDANSNSRRGKYCTCI